MAKLIRIERKINGAIPKGKILRVRLGINPNSSGYGILMGSLVFLPPAIISTLLLGGMEVFLNKAIETYRAKEIVPTRFGKIMSIVLWGTTWACFLFVGFYIIFSAYGLSQSFLWIVVLFALMVVSFMVLLVYDCRHNYLFVESIVKAAKTALFLPIIVGFLYTRVQTGYYSLVDLLAISILFGYLLPLALVFAGIALKLSGVLKGRASLFLAGLVYILLGVLFLFPLGVFRTGGYSPVGILFPLWGWMLPTFGAIYGLMLLKGRK